VEGEIGRFTFKTFDVKGAHQKPLFQGIELFPVAKGKQWYPTCGFKEIALIHGAAQRSYRQTVQVFNRSRRQESGGTPLNTLRDMTEAEGLKVLDFLARKTENIFLRNHFSPEGRPEPDHPLLEKERPQATFLEPPVLESALAEVCKEMAGKGLSAEAIEQVRKGCGLPALREEEAGCESVPDEEKESAGPAQQAYEDSRHCVYIHLDDVGVKEQKQQRGPRHAKAVAEEVEAPSILSSSPPPASDGSEKGTRPMVQNTVGYIEHQGKSFTLTARSVGEVVTFILAFLLNHDLAKLKLMVCTDGQRSLQDAVLAFFSWHPCVTLLLDWFHLVKKFKEDLSLACKGREIRNRHLKPLLTWLWFGRVDQAKAYLLTISASDLKNAKMIDRLCGYLERNRKWIPCYALRSKLNLPNSSSPAERCNNLVTARRQKRHGMSWSENGSYALTALNAVTLNGAARQWAEHRTMPFALVAKAA
jgi:hypothetical protein